MISGFPGDTEESIYDMSEGANFILDENHQLLAANSSFFAITGLDYAILEDNLNFLSLVPDSEVLLFMNFFKKRLDDPYNSPKTSEFRVLDSGKNEHKLILTAARIPETRKIFISSLELGMNLSQGEIGETGGEMSDDAGQISGTGGPGRLSDQYFHFSYLVENQHEPVFVLVGSVIVYVNEAGIRFLGVDNRYDIIGKSPYDFLDKDTKNRLINVFREMKSKKVRHPVEESLRIRGGELIDVEISSVPIIYEGIAGSQYQIRDITSRKRSEEQAVLRLRQIEIVNSVLESTVYGFSLPEILENVLKKILESFEIQSCFVYLKNNDPSTARLASSLNVPIWFKERYNLINIREWPYNIIFYGGQPRYIENLPDRPPGVFDVKILEDLGAISYAGIPVFSEKNVVGVFYVTKGDNSCFTPFEKATLEEIGKEVGSAVVKGLVEEKFGTEYNAIKDLLGIALKENDRIWNTIISHRWDKGDGSAGGSDCRMDLINEIGPRMDIINNLRVVYDFLIDENRCLKPICIDSVIRSAIYHFAGASIEYDRALYFVFADDNLSYVFINILNMFSLNREDFSLNIRHSIRNGEISVIISDRDRSGVIDNIEGMLNVQPEEALRPSNIAMYATRMLVAAYNGTIGILKSEEDGEAEKSLVITLKRYGRS
ncbi:GAF domain-containing protein [Methanolacinia paynteri]|uniref:GAF domain-containing protein n=1 Tax=Methanolacinia paynteri TaxID=230356 RepID=UPI00064EFF8D|nr:GAF domain-containing protein [Methanolacinia paynteri]